MAATLARLLAQYGCACMRRASDRQSLLSIARFSKRLMPTFLVLVLPEGVIERVAALAGSVPAYGGGDLAHVREQQYVVPDLGPGLAHRILVISHCKDEHVRPNSIGGLAKADGVPPQQHMQRLAVENHRIKWPIIF